MLIIYCAGIKIRGIGEGSLCDSVFVLDVEDFPPPALLSCKAVLFFDLIRLLHLFIQPPLLYHMPPSLWHDGGRDSDKLYHQKYVIKYPGTKHMNVNQRSWFPLFLGCNTYHYLMESYNGGCYLFQYYRHTISNQTHLIYNHNQNL